MRSVGDTRNGEHWPPAARSVEAIVLAAGLGSRLGPLTAERPKCLVEVAGASILARQLDALGRVPDISGVTIVVGYRAELVEAELERLDPGIRVDTVFNPFFAEVNALASLWLALQRRPGDFAVVNGDTFFTGSCLAGVVGDDADLALLYSREARLRADAVKVVGRTGVLTEIGKGVPEAAAAGEFAGFLRCAGEGAAAALDLAERMLREPAGLRAYWYTLVRALVAEGRRVALRECDPGSWFEIDDRTDLETATNGAGAWAGAAAASR